MKRLLISVTILVLLVVPQFALGADVDDLKAAVEKMTQAWNSLDAETLASMFSQGAVAFDLGSAFPLVAPMVSTQAQRAEYSKMILSNLETVYISPYNTQYRVFGNTGIVWGHFSAYVKAKGVPGRTTYQRATSTWIKSDGKWLQVMSHNSAIPPGD